MSWTDFFRKLAGRAPELPSPKGIIPRRDVVYSRSLGTITVKNLNPDVWLTTVETTNSMEPLIDAGDIVALTTDFKHEDLGAGDIVYVAAPNFEALHRIVKITYDKYGRRFRTKGDHSFYVDPYILRDVHISRLLIQITYVKKEVS